MGAEDIPGLLCIFSTREGLNNSPDVGDNSASRQG